MRAPATAPVAAASLIAGYAVAAGTGVRPLGGLALAAGTAWCAREWTRKRGSGVAGGLLGVQLVCFIGSHLLASPIGAWPSVLVVATVSGTAAYVVADRPPAQVAA